MGFPSAVLLRQGQSITGSFNKLQVMASGSVVTAGGSAFAVGHLSAIRDGNGNLLVNSGSPMFLPPGAVVELMMTSASLDASSAPIMFFTI